MICDVLLDKSKRNKFVVAFAYPKPFNSFDIPNVIFDTNVMFVSSTSALVNRCLCNHQFDVYIFIYTLTHTHKQNVFSSVYLISYALV